MSAQDRVAKPPAGSSAPVPAADHEAGPRSGAGASSALQAMLKKRQQRASHDFEAAQPDNPHSPDNTWPPMSGEQP